MDNWWLEIGGALQACETDLHGSECEAADLATLTADELDPPLDPKDPPAPPPQCPESPIVLDLGQYNFWFTDAAEGVRFDIDGDGYQEAIAWTDPSDSDAFLWLDLLENGYVDSGVELFGTATQMPGGGTARHGFVALWIYDLPELGGDADGSITAGDMIWSHLRLWVDADHSGSSSPEEIIGLDEHRILGISLDYKMSNRHDKHGNLIRYCSLFEYLDSRARVRESKLCDVFLLEGEQ